MLTLPALRSDIQVQFNSTTIDASWTIDRGIQQQNAEVRILQFFHGGLKHSRLAPAIEALKHTVPFAETFGQITPGSTGLGNPPQGIHEQTIVFGGRAWIAFLSGQQVTDDFPLVIRNLVASQNGKLASDRMRRVSPPSAVAAFNRMAMGRRASMATQFRVQNDNEAGTSSTVAKTAETQSDECDLTANLSAHAEQFVQSIKQEALDHFIDFGEDHLRLFVTEYPARYLQERQHQGVGNVPLSVADENPLSDGVIVCHERLGGLLKHYERKAA